MKMEIRGSGLLLHITSLPSRFGIGDLGPSAYRFADFLAAARQRYWQILPLDPTESVHDNSPYSGTSGFASNPLLISPDLLVEDGLLDAAELEKTETFPDAYVDFERVIPFKTKLLDMAFDRFVRADDHWAFERYCRDNASWLDDYALFAAIGEDRGGEPWKSWPDDLRRRQPDAIRKEAERLSTAMDRARFRQFVFDRQWHRLRKYCHDRDIRIIGDMPMFMAYDSADVWLHPEYFQLDDDLRMTFVAGVPADYFNPKGQLWGFPVYRWEALRRMGFAWWTERIRSDLALVDHLRVDHFRGFVAYWRIPAGSRTALVGEWVPAPARRLLNSLIRKFPYLPLVAEDLGTIDPDVRDVMEEFGVPGMRVLVIAFQEGFLGSLNIPHHAVRDSFVYTGTHDTNTVRGWVEDDATEAQRLDLRLYLGRDIPARDLPWEFIRLAMSTVADTVIIPVQDLLGLGSEARMNRPGFPEGNWRWRLREGLLTPEIGLELRNLTRIYERD